MGLKKIEQLRTTVGNAQKLLIHVLDIIFIGKRKQNNGNYTEMKTIESEESLTALAEFDQ